MPTYHIRLKGHLDDHWSAWFEDMMISNEANGEAVLAGPLTDQAALHGVYPPGLPIALRSNRSQ